MTASSPQNSPETVSTRGRLRQTLNSIPGYRPLRLWVWYLSVYLAMPPLYPLWVLPRTWYRLLRDVLLARETADDPIMAYAYDAASNLAWYKRTSNDVRFYGPNGYAYGDALGSAIGDRFFTHILSYGWLFGWLTPRWYAVLSGGILLASLILMGALTHQLLLSLVLALIVVGSPAFIMSLLHLSKPENLGWSLLPLTIFFMASDNTAAASISLFLVSITSITMVFPAAAIAIVLWISGQLPFLSLFLIGLPSGLKVVWQFGRFVLRVGLSQFTEVIGGGGKQQTVSNPSYLKYRRTIVTPQIIWCVLQTTLVLALLISGAPWGHAVAMLVPVVLLLMNYRVFRWADQPTFGRLFLAVDVAYAMLFPSWIYWIPMIIVLMGMSARLVLEAGGLDLDHLPGRKDRSAYPHTATPLHLGRPAMYEILQVLSVVPDGHRIAWQAVDPFGKSVGGYRHFHSMLEWQLWDRRVEVMPGEWLRATQTDWYVQSYAKLGEGTAPQECRAICEEAGIQFILAVGEPFKDSLVAQGFSVVGCLTPDMLRRTCFGPLLTPPHNLYVVKVPIEAAIIEPNTTLQREKSHMEFEGRANITYFIKYNYHQAWSAHAQGQPLALKRVTRGTLSGIEVTPAADGLVMLDFKASWLL
jgi:hypothetical protein